MRPPPNQRASEDSTRRIPLQSRGSSQTISATDSASAAELVALCRAADLRLGVAYAKLGWSQEMAAYAGSEMGKDLKDLIRERKKGRTILARCDSEACVKVGQQLGITLFQGRDLLAGTSLRRWALQAP